MSLFTKKKLNLLDRLLFSSVMNNINIMPKRFVKLIAYYYPDARVRKEYLKKMGLYMGVNTYSNSGLSIAIDEYSSKKKIIIGNNVSIAPNVTFVVDSCANNGIKINEILHVKEKLTTKGRIIVEDEVWIGASVTILPNVRIGKCSIIGAGSVVNKNVEPFSIVAGNPIRKIRDLK